MAHRHLNHENFSLTESIWDSDTIVSVECDERPMALQGLFQPTSMSRHPSQQTNKTHLPKWTLLIGQLPSSVQMQTLQQNDDNLENWQTETEVQLMFVT
jgi:hypothetical protein